MRSFVAPKAELKIVERPERTLLPLPEPAAAPATAEMMPPKRLPELFPEVVVVGSAVVLAGTVVAAWAAVVAVFEATAFVAVFFVDVVVFLVVFFVVFFTVFFFAAAAISGSESHCHDQGHGKNNCLFHYLIFKSLSSVVSYQA